MYIVHFHEVQYGGTVALHTTLQAQAGYRYCTGFRMHYTTRLSGYSMWDKPERVTSTNTTRLRGSVRKARLSRTTDLELDLIKLFGLVGVLR